MLDSLALPVLGYTKLIFTSEYTVPSSWSDFFTTLCLTGAILSFRYQVKCHLCREAFSDHPVNSSFIILFLHTTKPYNYVKLSSLIIFVCLGPAYSNSNGSSITAGILFVSFISQPPSLEKWDIAAS